jgi:hypothetical protein
MPWGYHTASNLVCVHWGDYSQMKFDMELAQEKLNRFIQADADGARCAF